MVTTQVNRIIVVTRQVSGSLVVTRQASGCLAYIILVTIHYIGGVMVALHFNGCHAC